MQKQEVSSLKHDIPHLDLQRHDDHHVSYIAIQSTRARSSSLLPRKNVKESNLKHLRLRESQRMRSKQGD